MCNLYRKLHGSRSINEKSHACLAKCLKIINIILLHISMLNLTVFVNEVLSTICFANFRNKDFQVCHFLFKETFSNTSIHPSKVF